MSLVIDPHYYDFYSRGLLPTVDYWPISENDMCGSINNAVKWGNKHAKQVTFFLAFLVDFVVHMLIPCAGLCLVASY